MIWLMPDRPKAMGSWSWQFTGAHAILVIKYFDVSPPPPPHKILSHPAFDGTTFPRGSIEKAPSETMGAKGPFRAVGQRSI